MDSPKPAASRVRNILQAMERSIDSARARRTGAPRPLPASSAPAQADAGNGQGGPAQRAASPWNAATGRPAGSTSSGQVMIGAPAPSAPAPAAGAAGTVTPRLAGDGQPPRLKAKPKRFEGAFNQALPAQNAYRSQAG
jgi:hypothetical protein